jgi:gag-polypeptide of LTR copia-type
MGTECAHAALSDTDVRRVMPCTTLQEMVTELNKVYLESTHLRKVTAVCVLVILKQGEGEGIREHLDAFTRARREIAAAGAENISDWLPALLIPSLSFAWADVGSRIELAGTQLTLQRLEETLLSKEATKEARAATDATPAHNSALAAQAPQVVYHNCGKQGHIKRDCCGPPRAPPSPPYM